MMYYTMSKETKNILIGIPTKTVGDDLNYVEVLLAESIFDSMYSIIVEHRNEVDEEDIINAHKFTPSSIIGDCYNGYDYEIRRPDTDAKLITISIQGDRWSVTVI